MLFRTSGGGGHASERMTIQAKPANSKRVRRQANNKNVMLSSAICNIFTHQPQPVWLKKSQSDLCRSESHRVAASEGEEKEKKVAVQNGRLIHDQVLLNY